MLMPLPSFSWANGAEVWNCMLEKDTNYAKLRNERMLEKHPALVDSYRTILFDWLSEVSHECKFHKETYHLALDFIDRYLSAQTNIGKLQLQLIGTTCLFLAAKFEEIRPPAVTEFADLTDGACRPDDILDNEINILNAINWEITPMTPNSWLNIYMQILLNLDTNKSKKSDQFILPKNNGFLEYSHKVIASVVDLALLHIDSLRFPNSILTASALFHFTSEQTVHKCTGYKYQDLAECIRWLEPFVETIKEIQEPVIVSGSRDENQNIQMHIHVATASLLEKTIAKMESRSRSIKRKACDSLELEITDSENESVLSSPTKSTTVLLTPPSSTRKSRRVR